MPRSKTGAGPGHVKSRDGQMRYILLFSASVPDWGRTGARKSRYRANGVHGFMKTRSGANC